MKNNLHDNISPEKITRGLKTRFIGQRVVYFPTLNSTMEAARREAQWGAPAGTVVITEEQTAGRGRLKRAWISPRGGLAMSVILRPNLDYLPYMIMLSSLAVAAGIEDVTGIRPQIKWPNDVLINEKKVCGILIENDIRRDNLAYCVIGIGINVNLHVLDFPEIAGFATSLSDETGKAVSRLEVARSVLVEMEKLYRSLPHGEAILEEWKSRLITLGQNVRVAMGETVLYGTAESVDKDGGLMLRDEDFNLIKVVAGDVTLSKA